MSYISNIWGLADEGFEENWAIATFLCWIQNVFWKFKKNLKQIHVFRKYGIFFSSVKATIPQKCFLQALSKPEHLLQKTSAKPKTVSLSADLTRCGEPKPEGLSPLSRMVDKSSLGASQRQSEGPWTEQSRRHTVETSVRPSALLHYLSLS